MVRTLTRSCVVCFAVLLGHLACSAQAGPMVPESLRTPPTDARLPVSPPMIAQPVPANAATRLPLPNNDVTAPSPDAPHTRLTAIWLHQTDAHRGDSFTATSTNDPYARKSHLPLPMVGVTIPLQ